MADCGFGAIVGSSKGGCLVFPPVTHPGTPEISAPLDERAFFFHAAR